MTRFPRPGRLEWIGVRGQRRGPLLVVQEAMAKTGIGLVGDHYKSGNRLAPGHVDPGRAPAGDPHSSRAP
jgi:hypothetical protein